MEHRQQTAALFARLVNIPDLAQLSTAEQDALANELVQLQPRLAAYIRAWAKEPTPPSSLPKLASMGFGDSHAPPVASEPFQLSPEEKEEISLLSLLKVTHGVAWKTIHALLDGKPVHLPDPGEWTGQIQGRKMREHYEPHELDQRLYPALLEVLRHTPFPLSRCAFSQCGKVFVQPGRGKPRRYCSESCKAKGIPSAAKRTEYKRKQRQQARERELRLARSVMQQTDSEQERLRLLSEAFRKQGIKKNRRQLLFLLKRAGQAA
ncbi:MAG: hypothetical protein HYZ50_05205 [Deltaproteobacteria bacterium]|nr:hypothetical protein [Deltaproteobacteria bacterium]